MKNRDDLRKDFAKLLKRIRLKNGLSKSKMAQILFIDDHTWNNYETGQSCPSVPDFIWLLHELGENSLLSVLEYIYPEIYSTPDAIETNYDPSTLLHFINTTASAHHIAEMNYSLFGSHGSSFSSQLDMLTMYNHLPLVYKVVIAQQIYSLYKIAASRNELIETEQIMPNVDNFVDGLTKAEEAAKIHRSSYSTILK